MIYIGIYTYIYIYIFNGIIINQLITGGPPSCVGARYFNILIRKIWEDHEKRKQICCNAQIFSRTVLLVPLVVLPGKHKVLGFGAF